MKQKSVRNSEKIAVTFETAPNLPGKDVALVGDFNEWDERATPMKRRSDGSWSKTVNLTPGTYRYRFLVDGKSWLNDPHAARYEPSGLGSENSVVEVRTS
jgi:1,4-alpha-glucan branching enzyme